MDEKQKWAPKWSRLNVAMMNLMECGTSSTPNTVFENHLKEEWADVPGYEGLYRISTIGRLKSLDRIIKNKFGKSYFRKGRYITIRKNNFGYLDTRLYKNSHKKSAYLHRLLAETFIPNSRNLPQVNHINGIKTDNRLVNLEWVSASENVKHAHDTGLCKKPRYNRRQVIDTCSNQVYVSMREAAKANNIDYGITKNILKGIKKNNTCLCLLEQWNQRIYTSLAIKLTYQGIYNLACTFNVCKLITSN